MHNVRFNVRYVKYKNSLPELCNLFCRRKVARVAPISDSVTGGI